MTQDIWFSRLSQSRPTTTAHSVLAIELSNKSWVLAAQFVAGLARVKARQTIEPTAEALLVAIPGLPGAGHGKLDGTLSRVIASRMESPGWSGFWLARWLAVHEIETYVVQPSKCSG